MKKLLAVLALSVTFIFAGCGGDDDDGGGGGTTTPTLTANKTVGSPSLTNVNDSKWNSVTSTAFEISGLNAPKLGVPKSASVSDSVWVQAIISNDSLFVRVYWDDDSHNIWRDYYNITDTNKPMSFTHYEAIENEDQLMLMFDGAPGGGWDCWNWRSLTTNEAGLGEGYRYDGTLTRDAGQVTASNTNPGLLGTAQPTYVHEDTASFTGYLLPLSAVKNYTEDTTIYGNYINQTDGWTVGQRIPGWIIDTEAKDRPENERNSRLDIAAAGTYSEVTNRYLVVMARKLNTGYADDADLSAVTSVKFKVAILNNQSLFTLGSTSRGFTKDINLTL